MHTDSFHHHDGDIHTMKSKANCIGALGSALFVLAIFACILLTAVVIIVGITHWSFLVVACTAFFCGSLIFFGIRGFMALIREGATTYATVVHAAFEHRRSGNIFLADPSRVVVREGAPLLIESTRTINETHHYHEDEMLLPEQAESLIKAPPFRQVLPLLEKLARDNKNRPIQQKKWYYGHDMDGKPIIRPLYDLRSCAVGGAQGQGKTSGVVVHAYQACANDFSIICFDQDLWQDEGLAPRLAPIRDCMPFPPAGDNEEEIMERVEWLNEKMEQRTRKHGMKNARPIFVFLDELNKMLRKIKDKENRNFMLAVLKDIGQNARKYQIFLIASAQDWQGANVGGADIRYMFPSGICYSAHSAVMRLLLDVTEAKLNALCEPPLQTLQAFFAPASGGEPLRLLTPPSTLEDGAACNEIRLQVQNGFPQGAMNRPSSTVSEVWEDGEPDDGMDFQSASQDFQVGFRNTGKIIDFQPVQQPLDLMEVDSVEADPENAKRKRNKEIEQIMLMDIKGAKNEDIYREVYGVTGGGRKYQQAAERLRKMRGIIAARQMKAGAGE